MLFLLNIIMIYKVICLSMFSVITVVKSGEPKYINIKNLLLIKRNQKNYNI